MVECRIGSRFAVGVIPTNDDLSFFPFALVGSRPLSCRPMLLLIIASIVVRS